MTYDQTVLHGVTCPHCGAFEQAEPVMYSNRKQWIWVFCRKCLKYWRKDF
jgi:hypothetical protein